MFNSLRSIRALWLLFAISVGFWIYLLPTPGSLHPRAWALLAIFVSTILAVVLDALPMGIAVLIGISFSAISGALPFAKAFSGFSNEVVWLVLCAFFISHGLIQTGLGRRVAYWFIALFGKKTIGLGYGVVVSELFLAPAIPSVTARSGAIVFPIVQALSHAFSSRSEDGTQKRLGSYLVLVAFQSAIITSAMFLTAMSANPLCVKLAAQLGVSITFGQWLSYAIVPGLVCLLVMPLIVFYLEKPQIEETPEAAKLARQHLIEMGPISRDQWFMLFALVGLLFLWTLGPQLGVSAASAGFLGLTFLVVTGVLKWSDLLKQHNAWDTFVWFGGLVALAEGMGELGLAKWFGESMAFYLSDLPQALALVLVGLIYFYVHYFFASSTAHVGALYLPFLTVSIALGAPALEAALALGFASSLFGGLTHYGCGPAPILFGSGFVQLKDWWRVGFCMSVVNLGIFASVGLVWWKWLSLS